jgi:hypothetical protein
MKYRKCNLWFHRVLLIIYIASHLRYIPSNSRNSENNLRIFCSESTSQGCCLQLQLVWSIGQVQTSSPYDNSTSSRSCEIFCWLLLRYQYRDIRPRKFASGVHAILKIAERKLDMPKNLSITYCLGFWASRRFYFSSKRYTTYGSECYRIIIKSMNTNSNITITCT